MSDDSKAKKLVHLCSKYQEYLSAGASDTNGLKLSEALEKYGLNLHAEALSLYIGGGDVTGGFRLASPWSSSKCYLTKYPPQDADPLDIWFDPYELSFMVRTVNPLGYGKAVIGWVSISPVFYWQYHVFQQLVKFNIRDDSFLQVDDLLASRPFGVDKWDYASDVYHEEAAAYAFWHGKWVSSNIRSEAITELLSSEQLKTVFPEGMSYWDASFSGAEDSRAIFNCGEDKTINKYSIGEWDRSNEIGFMTVITDQVGLISNEVLPRESGECLTLQNCSRKV
ncbi:hypothetical protein [Alkalimarinus sediminis]|uniref:Uncharacterized protein n=1 Tax=Alkalimarinus sediminis TaxID=1632866 RepID=A0A9E8KQ98_9ALTE|nr:hypothetical protein [Alkalimarinus sediminis]UZW74437.1 hypothetical protein NNL22_15640 [Alkalimarinus sediminis]